MLEQQLIKEHNSIKNGYNSDEGGAVTHHSQETKRKIGEANRKRKITPTIRKNMSKGQLGNNNRGKNVECVETHKLYRSAREAGREFGKDHSMIARACRDHTKTAYGYH